MTSETLTRAARCVVCRCGREANANGRECATCFRARLGSLGIVSDMGAQRKMMNRLEAYRRTRMEGIQPRTTSWADIDQARRLSDQTGVAFRADRAEQP